MVSESQRASEAHVAMFATFPCRATLNYGSVFLVALRLKDETTQDADEQISFLQFFKRI